MYFQISIYYLHTCILSVGSAFKATGFLLYTYISEMVFLDIKKYILLCICTFCSQEDCPVYTHACSVELYWLCL